MTTPPLRRAAPALAAVFAPALAALLLSGHLFSAGPRAWVPLLGDEVAYWNQIAAFSRAGMRGGYHTINEQPSRAGFSRFGPHGPVFPAAYGSLGRMFGWRPYSGAMISTILVTLAAAWWSLRAGAGWWGALALATFWPLILFLPSTMQEPLHFAIAITLAAAIARLAAGHERASAAVVVACLAAGFLRPTWAFVAIPAAWAATRTRSRRARAASVAAAAVAAVVVGALFGWIAAPYPGAIFSLAEVNPAGLASQAAVRAAQNVYAFVVPVEADPIEVLVRYETLGVFVAAAVAAWRARNHGGGAIETFIALMLGVTLAALIAGGSVERWRDFRVLSPVLLLSLLAWLPAGSAIPRAIVLVNVAAAPVAMSSFERLHAPRFAPQTRTEYFARAIDGVLEFTPGADGWQNTVLMHPDAVDPALVALPHGISLSVAFAWEDVALPPRSRYLLLRPRDVDEVTSRAPLRLLAQTPLGRLYDNPAMVQSPR